MSTSLAPEGQVDSPQAWRVAIASSAVVAVSFGTIYTFGAFFDAMANEFDSGLGATSIVFGITAFLFFGTGAASGFLADRFGARPLVWIGGAMFAIGLFLTSRVDALWQGYLTYGIGAGLGGGLFVAPVFAMVAGWFDRQRGIAQGIVATGSGIGTLILLPLAGASSIVGRLVLTGFAGRVGPVRMLQLAFLVQPVAFLIWLFAGGSVPVLVVFVLVLGVAYGGYVALVPLVAAHLFGVRGLGAIMGWGFLAGGVGSLFVPPLVGFLGDAVDGQALPILAIAVVSALGAWLSLGLQQDPI